jgi:Domain of unknown function (DUF4340)
MVRRNTWIVLIVLVGLIGFSFYLGQSKAKQAAAATPTAGQTALFDASLGSPTDIRVEDSSGNAVEIARDQSGKWVLKAPTAADANQASAEAAATQLGALQVLSSVDLGLDVIGLDKPSYTITVTYNGGKTHTLLVGSETPIQNGYYVQLDGGAKQVVDKAGVDALTGMLNKPPYLATLTPVASVTPTLAPVTPTVVAPTTEPPTETPASSPTPTGTP